VERLKADGKPFSLAAPTGRAANVMSVRTGQKASTLHKAIYNYNDIKEYAETDETGEETFKFFFALNNSQNVNNHLFIVDESSMLSKVYSEGEFFRFGSGFLLQDLLEYSKLGTPNCKNKILFIGDPAQLPPVGMDFSPALSDEYLWENFRLESAQYELTTVHRQSEGNKILDFSLELRKCIERKYFNHFNIIPDNQTIFETTHADFFNTYFQHQRNAIIVAYKNKTAHDFNQQIRKIKFPDATHITASDHIIVGRNNYPHAVFNGEFGVVVSAKSDVITRNIPVFVFGQKKIVTLRWRWVDLLFKDEENNDKSVSGYMLENFLETDSNNLSSEEMRALYIDFKIRNQKLEKDTPEFKDALKNDLFFNAIQLKYGYAVTCHKAQGGEWDHVFVLWDYNQQKNFSILTDTQTAQYKTNINFYRWAYAAVTRTRNKLFNLNPPSFSPFSKLVYVPSKVKREQELQTGENVQEIKITITEEDVRIMESNKLKNEPLFLQNKFYEIRHLMQQRYIVACRYNSQPYQEFYRFWRKGDETKMVNIAFYYNGKQQFTKFGMVKCGIQNSEELYNEIARELEKKYVFSFEKTETDFNIVDSVEEYDIEIVTFELPCQEFLFWNLRHHCMERNIWSGNVEHLYYRDRYNFKRRNHEKATIDFIYNEDGFYTSAEDREFNSPDLMIDLYEIIQKLIKG
jgi:hypothetical protein